MSNNIPMLNMCYASSTSVIHLSVHDESVSLTLHNSKNFIFYAQKFVADFYISDFQSGLRALVKAGYGAKVAPFVEPATVVDVTKDNRELSPNFLGWLADRKLSSDDRIMRLKEGYALCNPVYYFLHAPNLLVF